MSESVLEGGEDPLLDVENPKWFVALRTHTSDLTLELIM